MSVKIIARNKKAFHLYHITDKIEAGIVLAGTEVKALREGSAVIQDCYVKIHGGEAVVVGLYIGAYQPAAFFNRDPKRERKLLLHKKEIMRLVTASQAKGFTIVPLSLYFKNHYAKIEIGLGKGKKAFDKREDIKERDEKRDLDRAKKDRRD